MSRIRFANQLRGVAALSVACSHWIGVFWVMPDVVSAATATRPQLGEPPALFWVVSHTWFNPGPFGVALFFLISGLVVPFSLDHHGRVSFLMARALRIFPTYVIALSIQIAAVAVAASMWARPIPFTWAMITTNLLLVYDLVGQPSIDLVNWTLSVELKFYVIAALLAPWLRKASVWSILFTCLTIFGINGVFYWSGQTSASPSTPSYTFSSHSLCIIYMLLGTLFQFHFRNRLSTLGLVAALVLVFVTFVATWQVSVWTMQYPIVTANYLWAFVLFSSLYGARRFTPSIPLLDWAASISFPFYLLHSLLGYVSLRTMMLVGGLDFYAALAATFAIIVSLAVVLHVLIERPTQLLGRRLQGAETDRSTVKTRSSILADL